MRTKFLGVQYSDGEFHVTDGADLDPEDPMDKIKLQRLSLLHQICNDFDDLQEERLA